MSAGPVVVLSLDACDGDTVLELAASGQLPTVASLLATGRTAAVRNPFGLFVGAVWPTLVTGCRAATHRRFCWNVLDGTTYDLRLSPASELRHTPFWEVLGTAGREVAVVDVPHALARPFDGELVTEWGAHDRHQGLRSWPPALVDDVVADHGLHPVFGIDPYATRSFAPDDWLHRAEVLRDDAEDAALLADLLEGVDRKAALVRDRYERRPWDVFVAVFGESHAGGHHLWHRHDARHPRYDAAWVEANGDAVVRLYRRLDEGVAHVLDAVDPSATVVLHLSHGMGPHFDGTHLLEECALRILASDAGGPLGGPAVRAVKRSWRALPEPARVATMPLVGVACRSIGRRRGLSESWHQVDGAQRRSWPWFASPNNSVYGGIRFNVVGRESAGIVDPADVDRLVDVVRRDLLDLVDVDTGRRAIRAVHRTDDHHARSPDDEFPDLLVDWERSNPIETVWSPKTGLVHGPFGLWRTGDHRPDGRVVVSGPGVVPGVADAIDAADLAPSLCARVGVDLPGADGTVVDWLAGR